MSTEELKLKEKVKLELDLLERKRASVKGKITRIENFVNDNQDNNDVDVNEFVTRETLLIQAYEKCNTLQEDIEIYEEKEGFDREEIEERYIKVLSAIKRKISEINKLESNNKLEHSFGEVRENLHKVHLPNIQIPIFNGQFSEWNSFRDLFKTLVDDNGDLSDVQKFTYLKASLKSEPLNLIKDLQLTNTNYKVAFDILNKRYDDTLAIVNMHLSALIEVNSINKGDCKQLREFITNIKQNFNSLQALNLPVDTCYSGIFTGQEVIFSN